jgi:DNA invertase Pin-like site-specific DNA recombinase
VIPAAGVGHTYGYGRVSTLDQNPDLQTDALLEAGAERLFVDKASATLDRRPQLENLFEVLLPGDTVVVWRLDRFGRSVRQLIDLMIRVDQAQVQFRSLTSPLISRASWSSR